MKNEASITSSGSCTFVLPTCSRMSPGLNAGTKSRRILHDSVIGPGAILYFFGCGDVDADPAVSCFPKTDEVVPDFFRGVDRQGVAGGAVLDMADKDADDFALEIQDRSAGFPPLGGNIYSNMRGGEITFQKFPVEARDSSRSSAFSGDPGEIRSYHRHGHFHRLRFPDRQRRRGDVRFEDRDPAPQIRHHDPGGIRFPFELDRQVTLCRPQLKRRCKASPPDR